MKIYKSHLFSVTIPNIWEGEYDDIDQYDVLYNPGGVGELQLSSMLHDKKLSIQDLKNIAEEDIHAGAKPGQVQLGDFNGITFEYDIENEYWSEWYLASENHLLFITYNCILEKEGQDGDDIELILGTLKSLHAINS